MQLIELSANRSSFKTIVFKPGINIILGKMVSQDSQDTYNGVGKTLLLRLIHFCLGSQPDETLKKDLAGWTFTLQFEINDIPYSVTRGIDCQGKVLFCGREISLEEYTRILGEQLFLLEDKIPYLTFRNLVKRFLRLSREGYNSFDVVDIGDVRQPTNSEVANAYLLGLDVDCIHNKSQIVQDIKKIRAKEKELKNDEVIKEFFCNGRDEKNGQIRLQQQIKELEKKISNLDIAEHHNSLKEQADAMSDRMYNLENELSKIIEKINQISTSLNIQTYITLEDITRIYNEAKSKMGDWLSEDLQAVERFHQQIIDKRKERLLKEKESLDKQRRIKLEEIKRIGQDRDQLLKFISQGGAFDEFNAINQCLGSLKNSLEKLNSFKRLSAFYVNKRIDLEHRAVQENEETQMSLKDRSDSIEEKQEFFSTLVKRFYGVDVLSGIQIASEGSLAAKKRYHIDAVIESDSSDGISAVKIFCYDLMILLLSSNNRMKCMFHDSRIFGDMDHRQITTLFEILYEKIDSTRQYIVTINDDKILLLQKRLDKDAFQKIIKNNIIQELSDRSVESKLLGIKVNLPEA
ncbi:DUF2326 domain-containing protein [Candidatus Avelusimicrobium fimicolum]|uniref:DUF2326 domain-containing protein n=1 Tax=Candidatus Avelusimicrobium fimicolum TaxID=3416216 RepID=UPI003D0A7C28